MTLPYIIALYLFLAVTVLAGPGIKRIPRTPFDPLAEGRTFKGGHWDQLGLNTESEAVLGASRRLLWNETGLYFSFFLPAQTLASATDDGAPIELSFYIDTRPESYEELYLYSKGAARLRFDVNQGLHSGKILPIAESGFTKNGPTRPYGRVRQLDEQLVIDGCIPWAALPTPPPAKGRTIALASRITKGDRLIVGCYDLDDSVDPESNPELFEVYSLSPAVGTNQPAADWSADEIIENGKPVLLLRWCEPAGSGSDASLQVAVDGLSYRRTLTLSDSAGGRFRWWCEHVPLDPGKVPAEIHVTFQRAQGEKQTLTVPLPLCARLKEIDAHLPKQLFQAQGEAAAALYELYRGCAMEVIQRLQTYPDSYRPNRRRYNNAKDSTTIDADLAKLYDLAAAHQQPTPGQSCTYAWRRRDGTISPFKVYFPKSYDPARPTSLIFHLHVANRYLTRSHFLASKPLERDLNFYRGKDVDSIVISTYGAGNNYAQAGQEELDYLLTWAQENLKINPDAVMLRGHSIGGSMALYLGSRMPDAIAAISTVSATPEAGLRLRGAGFQSTEQTTVKNLLGKYVQLTAGELDTDTAESNRRGYDFLKQSGVEASLTVVKKDGHFLGSKAPKPQWGHSAEKRPDRPLFFASDAASFDHAHGVTLEQRQSYARPAGFKLTFAGENAVMETTNVRRLKLEPSNIADWSRAKRLQLDGQDLGPIPSAQSSLLRDKTGGWHLTTAGAGGEKTSRRPGHAEDILPRDFVVIYGTRDPTLKPFLLERAYEVARAVSGTRRGQWAGRIVTILPDTEVSPSLLRERDIYLIGNSHQNTVTASLAQGFPEAITTRLSVIGKPGQSQATALQVIFPSQYDPMHYVFLEAGNEPLAYTGAIMKEPASDYAVCVNSEGWRILNKGDFDLDWKLANAEQDESSQ